MRVPTDCGRRRKARGRPDGRCPWRCRAGGITVGSMPQRSRGVEMREIAVVAEAQRHGVGRRADHRVGAEIVVRRRDGEGGPRQVRAETRLISCEVTAGMSAGRVSMPPRPSLRQQPHAADDAAGMAVARAVGHDARAEARRQRRRLRVDVTTMMPARLWRRPRPPAPRPSSPRSARGAAPARAGAPAAAWRRRAP